MLAARHDNDDDDCKFIFYLYLKDMFLLFFYCKFIFHLYSLVEFFVIFYCKLYFPYTC